MKLDSNNFPVAGMKDLVFETINSELHKGKYDFDDYGCRRWIDELGNVYQSYKDVINWWK